MSSLMYSLPDDVFIKLVENCYSASEAIREIGYSGNRGSTTKLFNKRCDELNISREHFTGMKRGRIKRTIENVFCLNSTVDQTTLRKWFFDGEYVEYKCSICGISKWNDKPLTLRLDHINGNNKDDRLENLRWICPNCDSQSDTFCGRNIKYLHVPNKRCKRCGKKCSSGANYCSTCSAELARKVDRPSKEQLIQDMYDLPITKIGEKYKVSDNAIRKWCKYYNIPKKRKEIILLFFPDSKKAQEILQKKEKNEKEKQKIKIQQLSKNNNVLAEYDNWDSLYSVFSNHSKNSVKTCIMRVCNETRETAYGYKWKIIYGDDN